MRKKVILTSLLICILFAATFMMITPVMGAIIWSEERKLTIHGALDAWPSIAHADNDTIWVVWKSRRDGNSEIYYKIHNVTWTDDTRLSDDPEEDIGPSIIQLKNGTIWVTWSSNKMGNYSLYYRISSDNGTSWSNDVPITANEYGDYAPSVFQTSDEQIWVVWQRKFLDTGDHEIICKVFNGSSWSTETQLTTDPRLDELPSITQTNDGKVWVFWCSDRADPVKGDWEIFYKIFDGFSWSADDEQLTTDPHKVDTDPAVFQDLDGKMWVIWTSRETKVTATSDLCYKTSSDAGTTWSSTIQLTTHPDDDMWPSAIQARDKRIWITWTSNRDGNYDLYYKTTLRGDVNDDGSIDILDVGLIARAMWTTPADNGTPGDWWAWNPACDLNNDGRVDVKDAYIAGKNYGTTAG